MASLPSSVLPKNFTPSLRRAPGSTEFSPKLSKYASMTAEQVLAELESQLQGLSEEEAASRLEAVWSQHRSRGAAIHSTQAPCQSLPESSGNSAVRARGDFLCDRPGHLRLRRRRFDAGDGGARGFLAIHPGSSRRCGRRQAQSHDPGYRDGSARRHRARDPARRAGSRRHHQARRRRHDSRRCPPPFLQRPLPHASQPDRRIISG